MILVKPLVSGTIFNYCDDEFEEELDSFEMKNDVDERLGESESTIDVRTGLVFKSTPRLRSSCEEIKLIITPTVLPNREGKMISIYQHVSMIHTFEIIKCA